MTLKTAGSASFGGDLRILAQRVIDNRLIGIRETNPAILDMFRYDDASEVSVERKEPGAKTDRGTVKLCDMLLAGASGSFYTTWFDI